jgi:hypothetical protein
MTKAKQQIVMKASDDLEESGDRGAALAIRAMLKDIQAAAEVLQSIQAHTNWICRQPPKDNIDRGRRVGVIECNELAKGSLAYLQNWVIP